MKVLVLGSGGREHAMVWKLRQSPRIKKLYCAPGNGGIAADAECVAADLKSIDSLVQLANQLNPDLTVVGPELPLTLGVVDEFQRRGWPIFGPTRAAAQLESSKSFAKEFMQRHHIPTAKYSVCTTKERSARGVEAFSHADRGEGRRTGCRQGRRHRAIQRRGAAHRGRDADRQDAG